MPKGKRPNSSTLGRPDWIRAGLEILSAKGVDGVRVEVIAKRLRISKGSFYWHFRDREDLLDGMLSAWESEHSDWELGQGGLALNAAESWARLLEMLSRPAYGGLDLAISHWAREDEGVQRRVANVERRRIAYLTQVFREVGFSHRQAEEWAQAAMLLYFGWVDRTARDSAFREAGPDLAEVLSRFILAASALASQDAA
jgi:AcrR family transcriptional regulator